MRYFNYFDYLRNYDIIQFIGKNKTKKQFNNFIRVMYGRKNDRGHIKTQVEIYISNQKRLRLKLYDPVLYAMPNLRVIDNSPWLF